MASEASALTGEAPATPRRVAVITGASSGLGALCADVLRDRGWSIYGLDRAAPLQPAAEDTHLTCDVAAPGDVARAFGEIERRAGHVNALICSAAISILGLAEDVSADDFDAMMAVNVRGSWLCARGAIPLLRRRASAEQPGRIVFVSSVASLRPKVGNAVYGASKAAVNHLTRVMAGELGPSHIYVNAVAPSWMDTPMTRSIAPAGGYRRSQLPPLGREATTRDAALMIAAMLGPDWTFTTGLIVPVDGGASQVYTPSG